MKTPLGEALSQIERESNNRLTPKDGVQAGPDPEVQRELKHKSFLNRVNRLRKQAEQ